MNQKEHENNKLNPWMRCVVKVNSEKRKTHLEFTLSHIDWTTNDFKSMENIIHVDKNWFYSR